MPASAWMPAAASGEASVMLRITCSRESWLGIRSRPCEPSASRSCASPVCSSSSSWSISCSTPCSTPMSLAVRAKNPCGSGSRSMRGTIVSQNSRSVVRCVSVRLIPCLSSAVASPVLSHPGAIGARGQRIESAPDPQMTDLDPTKLAPTPAAEGVPSDGRPRGGSLLAQISNAMVRIHKEHWGKGPTKARTIYTEDIVLTRLDQIFTQAEATLVRAGREEEVRNMRIAFQRELENEFVGAIERLTGRKVQAFISEIHAGTNMGIELFVLEPAGTPSDPSADTPRDGE